MVASVFSALCASALWGLADFAAGVKSRSLAVATVLLASQAFGLVVAALLVAASNGSGPSGGQTLASLAGGASGIAGLSLFYRALAEGTISIVAPIGATGVMLPVAVGVIGGDHVHAGQAVGFVAAIAGVVLAARHPDTPGAATLARHRRSIGLALLAAVGFGGYFIGSHEGVGGGVAWMLLLSHMVAVIGVLGAALAIRAPLLAARRHWPGLLAVGGLDMAATSLYAVANRHGLLSVVAVVGSLYPLTTVAMARLTLHEHVDRAQGVGVGLALGGVALIAAG